MRNAADKANIPELEDLSKLNNSSKPIKVTNARAHTLATAATDSQHHQRQSMNQVHLTTGKDQRKEHISQLFKTENNIKSDSNVIAKPHSCSFCSKDHSLDCCKTFQEKPFTVRKNFFFSKRLCLGWAQGNHQIKDCKKKPCCKHCGEDHLTCLHQDPKATNNCTNFRGNRQSCGTSNSMVVPVWVRSINNPPNEVLRYAILDDQSNVSFISHGLCNRLHLKGHPTKLSLTTVQESDVVVDSSKINDIEILDYNKEHVIKLPTLYTREKMPVSSSQIAKPKVIQKFMHLREVADQLIPYQANTEVSLLIGSNCPRALYPP